MGYARAAIAGMLTTGIVLMMVFPSETLREPERALAALAGILVVLALLLDVDIMRAWRERKKGPSAEPPPEEV